MHIRRRSIKVVRVALLGMALMALAACSNLTGPNADAGGITAQASGKFSGGSIYSGSVNGVFEAVGLGNVTNEPYLVEMTVNGKVWFSCINQGGNEAPGQLAFTLGDQGVPQPTDGADRNGKYVTDELTVDVKTIPDTACTRNKNWRVKTWADTKIHPSNWPAGAQGTDAVTYLQPASVTALLFEAVQVGVDAQGNPILEKVGNSVDDLVWNCENVPPPTYPLENYDFARIAPLSQYCSLQP